ncbi:MAG: aminotransferase class V-fold PLP-dependent enzyme [bacterium]|nr:aminotransferase class V-fold PLP-dependent enzyme [bacterium]
MNKEKKLTIDDLSKLVVGSGTDVPTRHGLKPYINFDNAASTPTFKPIVNSIEAFLQWYSNVHRGTGFKSQLSSWAFEEARDIVAHFVGADLKDQVVLFTKNTTEGINKLARRLPLQKDDVILTTLMEHHSNELPWRRVGRVVHVGLNDDGTISREDFAAKIAEHGSKIKLVAVTGASNVSGYINDLDFLASTAHSVGARILVDGAQLVPHRQIDMKPHDPKHRIDYLVFSAHKMYAPFGVGVLVGDRDWFEVGDPMTVGGGMVDIVTMEEAYWTDLPEKEEAGTPDIVGVVALGQAIRLLEQIGWEAVIAHESELTSYVLAELNEIPGVILYGDTDPSRASERLGVVAFNLEGLPHALTAAVLSYEGGIGVRAGCFCAHTYVKSLLKLSDEEARKYELEILNRDRSHLPGAVRASFGLYNTKAEAQSFVAMVRKLAAGEYARDYVLDKERGEYTAPDFEYDFESYYRF